MEVLLQCLDDFEDSCLASLLLLHRMRRWGLNLGFAASLVLVACEVLTANLVLTLFVSCVSVLMLALWFAGAAASLLSFYDSRPSALRA